MTGPGIVMIPICLPDGSWGYKPIAIDETMSQQKSFQTTAEPKKPSEVSIVTYSDAEYVKVHDDSSKVPEIEPVEKCWGDKVISPRKWQNIVPIDDDKPADPTPAEAMKLVKVEVDADVEAVEIAEAEVEAEDDAEAEVEDFDPTAQNQIGFCRYGPRCNDESCSLQNEEHPLLHASDSGKDEYLLSRCPVFAESGACNDPACSKLHLPNICPKDGEVHKDECGCDLLHFKPVKRVLPPLCTHNGKSWDTPKHREGCKFHHTGEPFKPMCRHSGTSWDTDAHRAKCKFDHDGKPQVAPKCRHDGHIGHTIGNSPQCQFRHTVR